jgi:hypothetical protein
LGQIAERYKFSIIPKITTREDLNKSGLLFGMGQLEHEAQTRIITDFAIYTDGLAAVSEKTEWADLFLDDVISWVKVEFGFREIETGIRTLYSSGVVVEFEHSPSNLVRQFNKISELISERTVTIANDRKKMDFARLDFEIDKKTLATQGQVAVSKFILERRASIQFARERYFSSAPMTTANHLQTLADIEQMAASS